MTAPDFRPFEQKFKGKRHLGPAQFLRSEEGGEWDEGSESESEVRVRMRMRVRATVGVRVRARARMTMTMSILNQKLPVRKSEREQIPDRLRYPERFISIK